MSRIFALYKKELKDSFKSPLVYILAGLFCLTMGWLFYNYLVLAKQASKATLTLSVLKPIFGNMNFMFLFLAPLLTMRSFAEEKKLNTMELLLLSNLKHFHIIVGKFLANLTTVLFMLGLTLVFPLVLAISGYSDWGIVISSYIGIILSIACYISVGMFASSLTDNQIVASLISFFILFCLMLLVMSANATENFLVGQIFSYASVAFHYEGFVRGAVRSFNIVYYCSFIGFFLFSTHKSLDSRNW